MKVVSVKTILCALACAAGSFPAHSMEVFGIVDSSVGVSKNGAGNQGRVDSGAGYGSRLGFRDVEDLGGGLKANIWLENGFNTDTGTLGQGGALFGRQSYVGLSSKAWSVSAGRQYSPLNLLVASSDAFGQTYWGNSQGTGIGQHSAKSGVNDGGFQAPARVNNSLVVTGTTGGLTGRLMLSAGDEKGDAGRSIGASLAYASGPVFVNAAVHREKQFFADLPAGAAPDWQQTWGLGGSYDFGIAKAFAGYYRFDPSTANMSLTSSTTLRTTSAWLGARVPVFQRDTIIGQVMDSRFKRIAGLAEGKSLTFGLAYEHAFSKRTTVYASYGRLNNNDTSNNLLWGGTAIVAPTAMGDDVSVFSAGMTHRF